MEILIFAAIAFIYFLPTIVGLGKHNFNAIFALNFFLGWTFIGWVVAFIWAVSEDEHIVKVETNSHDKEDCKKCPDCAETVKSDAKVCKHCSFRFDSQLIK
jgi:hypothetical protein